MTKLMRNVLFMTFGIVLLSRLALTQNPCAEEGPSCRPMTSTEVKALKERFMALKTALPVPDPAYYALASGVNEAYTMPFVAEANIPGPKAGLSWPAGCFTTKKDVSFPYDRKVSDKSVGKQKGAGAKVQTMFADMENRIEVGASLLPHPYLVDNVNGKCVDVNDPDAVNVEKSGTFLSWETGEESVSLHLIFGSRTCKEEETINAEKPAPGFAPVKSIELTIVGPKAEIAALKKMINRRAFEALLGPVVK